MKITKRQLKTIIQEEKNKLQENAHGNAGIFSDDYIYDLLVDEVELYFRENPTGANGLTRTEQDMLKAALMGAFQSIVEDFGL